MLEAMVKGLEADDLSALSNEKAGAIFEGVGDSVILTLPDDSKDAALDALDANFFDRGTRFNIDLPKDTLIEQLELETPAALQDLLSNITFIRSFNSIDCAVPGGCLGVVDTIRPVVVNFTLTTAAGLGGSVSPAGPNIYPTGSQVTITATPDAGFRFSGWSGNCIGSSDCLLTMDEDKSVTASFNAVDDHGDTIETATPVELDSVTDGFLAPQDLDYFTFQAVSGRTYNIVITVETLPDTHLSLFNSSERLADNDDPAPGALINYTAIETGPLFVLVLGLERISQGTYSLVVSSPPPAAADSNFAGEWTGSYTGTFINGACFTNVDGEVALSISQSGDQVFVSFDILQSRITYGPSCSVEGRENEGVFVVATVDGTSATSNEGFNKVNFNNAESPTLMAGEFDFRTGDFGSMGNFTATHQN